MKVGSVEGKMELPQNGFLTESRCMREITKTENGMEQSPAGGLMGKKCMFVLTQTELGMEKKQHGDRMGLQYNYLKSLLLHLGKNRLFPKIVRM